MNELKNLEVSVVSSMENSENEGVKPVVALVKFSAGPVVPLDMDQ